MKEDVSLYDTSNFDPNHPDPLIRSLFSKTNQKVLGKFKCETGSQAPLEFVGLRSKMYSLLVDEEEEEKRIVAADGGDGYGGDKNNKMTAKGIKKHTKKRMRHSDFVKTLTTRIETRVQFRTFASNNQQLETVQIDKVGLSAYDDKRYIHDDGITSYAYGHKNIIKAKRVRDDEEEGVPSAKRLHY
jgi:hypothetical protein